MRRNMRNKQAGFTLVEIAIVLVIIGLLLGGVLKGQELITQAKIKNVAKDFDSVTTAILGYQDRYKALPGDDKNAAGRWSLPAPTAATTIGDGNVDGTYIGGALIETGLFWAELRSAGFINGGATDTTPPPNAVGGILGVEMGAGAGSGTTGVTTGKVTGLSGVVLCSSRLPGKIAGAIDTQFDDGIPNTGSVRGFAVPGEGDVGISNTTFTKYTEDTNTTWVVCRATS